MNPKEKAITAFETRVRQMLLRFQELKKENEELFAMVEKNEQDLKELRAKLEQQERDCQSLKMARMLEITDSDLEGAKARVAKLIREVNHCIAVLNGEK